MNLPHYCICVHCITNSTHTQEGTMDRGHPGHMKREQTGESVLALICDEEPPRPSVTPPREGLWFGDVDKW